jgi:hypothetical protein
MEAVMNGDSLPSSGELTYCVQNLRKQVMTTNLWIEQYW